MRGSSRLLILLLAIAVPTIAAAHATAAVYSSSAGTFTVTAQGGETITMRAVAGGAEFTTDQIWFGMGAGGETGISFTGSAGQTLALTSSAADGASLPISAFRVVDDGAAAIDVLGTDGGAWAHPVTINLGNVGSTVDFRAGTPSAPITFGTSALTVTAPEITVLQEIGSAGSISLTGTSSTPYIRASMTAAAPGTITLNGARVRTVGTTTLTTGTLLANGPVVGITGCTGIEVSYCSIAPGNLVIHGNLITTAAWSDLVQLQVTGSARLGGDVTTSSSQDWQGPVYVTAPGTLTLTGSTIVTPQGVVPYTGPCGGDVIVTCDVGAQSPPATFSSLLVNGNWRVGGSVTPSDSIRATGLTEVIGTGANATFGPTTSGTQDYEGGLSIILPRAATLSGSTVTIAGMPEQQAAGSIGALACDTGPLTVIGALRVTGAIQCLDSLIVNGPATISADVATQRYQSYLDAVTLALGAGSLRLRAGAGQTVAFHGTPVTATWSRAAGDDITGYTATISPTGQTCSTSGALTCSFGGVPEASDLTFSVAAQRPASAGTTASTPRGTTGQTGTTLRRTVGRGSRTALASLISPPAVRGTRAWSERGQCSIRKQQLIAPNRAATCMLVLKVKRGNAVAWTGRATITVR